MSGALARPAIALGLVPPRHRGGRMIWWLGSLLIVLLVLGAAAFMAVREVLRAMERHTDG